MAPAGLDIEKRLDRIEAQGKAWRWLDVGGTLRDFYGENPGISGGKPRKTTENHGILGDFIVSEVGSNNSDNLVS